MTAAMSPLRSGKARRFSRLLRILRARPRLFIATFLGVVVGLAMPGDWRLATRILVGWDTGVAVYLAAVWVVMARSDIPRIRRRAALMDEGRVVFLILTAGASLASLGGIVVELGFKEAVYPHLRLALSAMTIVLSWAFIHVIFALHYAHEFYTETRPEEGGLAFPGKEEPDYWDFLYFSLVIGMTSQVSDVAVTSRLIRRTVAGHAVMSFFFNVALLALLVNIAAGALAG
jgi:uncharacterized membrane protein